MSVPKTFTDGLQEALEDGTTVIHVLQQEVGQILTILISCIKGEDGEKHLQPKPGNQRNQLTLDGVGQWGHCKHSRKPQNQAPLGSRTDQARGKLMALFGLNQ